MRLGPQFTQGWMGGLGNDRLPSSQRGSQDRPRVLGVPNPFQRQPALTPEALKARQLIQRKVPTPGTKGPHGWPFSGGRGVGREEGLRFTQQVERRLWPPHLPHANPHRPKGGGSAGPVMSASHEERAQRGGQARAHRWDSRGSLDFLGKALVGFSMDASSLDPCPAPC